MQGYGPSFARIYNLRWNNFAQQVAPRLRACYEDTPLGQSNRTLLDVCCGTGHLALYFLDSGYTVTGVDLSEAMLTHARANAAPYLVTGQASFIQADAANFSVNGSFGLAVSTFDALNHLPDLAALSGCFSSVFPLLAPGGTFIFDLNTRAGITRWASISVEDVPEMLLITRGLVDQSANRAYTHISGFLRAEDGRYDRFEETAYNTLFDLADVESALLAVGFSAVRFCRLQDLGIPVEEPERENRIYIVADKA
jgi:SAM-dependent methyltransferase